MFVLTMAKNIYEETEKWINQINNKVRQNHHLLVSLLLHSFSLDSFSPSLFLL